MATGFIGKNIGGRYEIKRLIGEGGMAEVYEAFQPRLNRRVAVKIMHRHLSKDDTFKVRFEREAQAIAQLKHPNIIQVYDFDFDKDLEQYYMVIEYVDGPTLSTVIHNTKGIMPLSRSLRIIEDLTNALGYAHAQKMLHRDIKPSNVMLESDTRTVLTDFGIAKLVQDTGQKLTASGAMVGTPAYISPEQASGLPGDARSDIYSLGIVFYQLVTGRVPYEGETPIATILKHIKEPPQPPSKINVELPLGIESAVLRCIAKNPDERYQNTDELLAHLRDQDAAAAEIEQSRTFATHILSDDAFRAEARTPTTPTNFTQVTTDTLTIASPQSKLVIGIGAIAIIALLALGAFFFSTSQSTPSATPENPCVLTLDGEIFARAEPDADVTANITFDENGEVEILQQSGSFLLIKGDDLEGWVTQDALPLPDGCDVN